MSKPIRLVISQYTWFSLITQKIASIAISDEKAISKDDLLLVIQLISLCQLNRPISLDEVAAAMREGILLVPALEGYDGLDGNANLPFKGISPTEKMEQHDNTLNPWSSNDLAPNTSAVKDRGLPMFSPSAPSSESNAKNEINWFVDRDRIKVSVMAEKGGVVFKHVNFSVESPVRLDIIVVISF